EVAIIPEPDQVVRGEQVFRLQAGVRCVSPEQLRGLASYFLHALPVDENLRPELVTGVQPAAGDIVLILDAQLGKSFALDIGEQVRLTACDARGIKNGLAALYQALRTVAGGGAPTGTYVESGPRVDGWLVLQKPTIKWDRSALSALLRECWLNSVQTVCFDGGSSEHATSRALREFTAHAKRLAIDIEGTYEPELASTAVPDVAALPWARASSGDRLAEVLVAAHGASRTVVLLSSDTPDKMLVQARQLLAAICEGAHAGARPVHVAGFLARLATRY